MLLRVIAVVALLCLPLGTATAQETSDADVPVVSLTRLSAESAVALPIAMPPAAAAALAARPRQDDEKETHRWDAIKTGFYAGLIVGGIVGVALVAECGHPECGPMLTIAAGVGGAIGMAIDALVDRRTPVEGVSAHGRSRARRDNRKVGISFRTSW